MNNYVKLAIAFLAGAATGSVITKIVIEKKKEEEFSERYESLVEYYSSEPESVPDDAVVSDVIKNEYEIKDGVYLEKYKNPGSGALKEKLARLNVDYTAYSKEKRQEELDADLELQKLQPIDPQPSDFVRMDFNMENVEIPHGYESASWSVYTDGVVVDDYGEIVDREDIDFAVGAININYFLGCEEEVMYIKNTANQTLYEITKEPMTYSEAYSSGLSPED